MQLVGFYFPPTGDVACVDCQPLWPLDSDFHLIPVAGGDDYQCDTCLKILDQVTPVEVAESA